MVTKSVLLKSCRHGKDELVTDESGKHILVMRNGHYYIFDVFDRDGKIYRICLRHQLMFCES